MQRAASKRESGVTLIEMMIVVTLIGLVMAVSFPSVNSGLDTLRLSSACNTISSFLNTAMDRANRQQVAVELTISRAENDLVLRSADPGFMRRLDLPDGVKIEKILPELPDGEQQFRSYLFYPGGTIPRLGVQVVTQKGARRIVRIDPILGMPVVEFL